MGFLIGLLTVVMVLDCVLLMLLVLIQLPKKEAGMGLAFGGAATDALFGAGSGTVLTKITKYAATIFFVLAVVLSMLQRNYHTRRVSAFEQGLTKPGPAQGIPTTPSTTPSTPATAPKPPGSAPAAVPGSNTLSVVPQPPVEDTNLPLAIPTTPTPPATTNK
jgi:preprotein translocase subunit SecG